MCEADQFWTDDERNGHQLTVEIYPDTGVFYISSFAHDENGETTELTAEMCWLFCPKCGRRLGL